MSDFTVNTSAVRSAASALDGLSHSALRISEGVEDACGMGGADSESMRAAIRAALIYGQSVRELSTSIRRLGDVLAECAALYEQCEESILSSAPSGNGAGGTPGTGAAGGTPGTGAAGGTPGTGTTGGTPGTGAAGGTPGSEPAAGSPGTGPGGGNPGGISGTFGGGSQGSFGGAPGNSGGAQGNPNPGEDAPDSTGDGTPPVLPSGTSGTFGDSHELNIRHPAGKTKIPVTSHTVTATGADGKTGTYGSDGKESGTDGNKTSGNWKIDNNKPLFTWAFSAPLNSQGSGKEGDSGKTGDSGNTGDAGKTGEAGASGKPGKKGKPGSIKPSGEKLYEWNARTNASTSYASEKVKIPGGSATGTIGAAEAHASAAASLYMSEGAEKKPFIAPYVSAQAGASASVLEGKISGKYGNDTAEISGSGKVTVGHVEASGSVSASVFDKKGNFAPGVSGAVKAEAVAASATGTLTGSFGGATASVTAGANLGIGAHAKIGVTPTSISCDVGASLGIGANFGFSLDLGGAVRAFCSSAQAIWNSLFTGKGG